MTLASEPKFKRNQAVIYRNKRVIVSSVDEVFEGRTDYEVRYEGVLESGIEEHELAAAPVQTIADTTPSKTYDGLLIQFRALRTLAASSDAIASNLRKELKDQAQTLADLDGERNTNAQLTEALEEAIRQRDLLAQAIANAAHKAGVIHDTAQCDGPTLLMVLDDMDRPDEDGERYRWLRDESFLDDWAGVHPCDEHLRSQLIDASIDCTMEATNARDK